MPIEVNGKSFETDEEGYLANLSEWEKDLATAMAKEDGIDLGDDHWEIINFPVIITKVNAIFFSHGSS